MNKPLSLSKLVPVIVVLVLGVALAWWILKTDTATPVPDEHGEHAEHSVQEPAGGHAGEPAKGPKGGKLFTEDGFSLEATIFETGVEPQFHFYLYQDNKPLPPTAATVSASIKRLGKEAHPVSFTPQGDYLLGDRIVEEPHSFDVSISASYRGKTYQWGYSQQEARVEMSDAQLQGSGIIIKTAGPALIQAASKLPGEIKLNAERTVQIVPRVAGVVVSVKADLGQTVKQGDVLAVIESQALAEMRSRSAAAQKRLQLAQTTYQREKQLWEEKITAEQDFLAARQALSEAEIERDLANARLRSYGAPLQGGNLTRYEIRAPIAGVLVSRDIAVGAALAEDAQIFTIADTSSMWVEVTVYPKDLPLIKVGQNAEIKATAFDATGQGKVTYISALVGEQTRTASARIVVNNADGLWRPGMFVDVLLATAAIEVPVAVSLDALQTVRDWTVVFGRYGNYFEARPVTLGRRDGEQVEVLEGLTAGEQYAAGNSFAIKADIGKSGASHDH